MAQTNDRYRILLTWSVLNVDARRTALTQVLHDTLIHSNQLCMIATGWAHDDLVPETLVTGIELNFITPKNSMTDAEVINIGNLIATAISERLVSIEKSDVLNLTIP
jgi:hypothetical protein